MLNKGIFINNPYTVGTTFLRGDVGREPGGGARMLGRKAFYDDNNIESADLEQSPLSLVERLSYPLRRKIGTRELSFPNRGEVLERSDMGTYSSHFIGNILLYSNQAQFHCHNYFYRIHD